MAYWDEYQQQNQQGRLPATQGQNPAGQSPANVPVPAPALQMPQSNNWSQKLMALGAGLLEASGPSRTPVSFGQALGAGINNMLKYDLQYGNRDLDQARFAYQMKHDSDTLGYQKQRDERNFGLDERRFGLEERRAANEEAYKNIIARKNEMDIKELESKMKARQLFLDGLTGGDQKSSVNRPLDTINPSPQNNDGSSAVGNSTPLPSPDAAQDVGNQIPSMPPVPQGTGTPSLPTQGNNQGVTTAPSSGAPRPKSLQEKFASLDPLDRAAIGAAVANDKYEDVKKLLYGDVPSGYMRDSKDPEKLVTIPGGPAEKMATENAAKAEMLAQGLKGTDRLIERLIDKNGRVDRSLLAQMNIDIPFMGTGLPFSEGRGYASVLRDALEAKIRAESGAAVPETEVKRMADRFWPSYFDDDPTIKDKLQRMKSFMGGALSKIEPSRAGEYAVPEVAGSLSRDSSSQPKIKRADALKVWLKRNNNKMTDQYGFTFDDFWKDTQGAQ